MQHTFKECGDGVHEPKALVFKDLKATWFNGPGSGPGESSGSREGCGRGQSGRGRGRGAQQQSTSEGMEEDDSDRYGFYTKMEDADRNR